MLQTENLSIPVPVSLAQEYKKLSGQEQKQMAMSIYLALQDIQDESHSLKEAARDMSREAKKNGLTEEILNELLNEE